MAIGNIEVGTSDTIEFGKAAEHGLPMDSGVADTPQGQVRPSRELSARDVPAMEIDPPEFRAPQVDAVERGSQAEDLRRQLEELKSERGRYGREVVGPLRQENEALRERLAKLEGRFEQLSHTPQGPAQPAPEPTAEEVAIALFGPDVDVSDPEVLRDARAQLTAMRVTDQSVDAKLAPVLQQLQALSQQLSAKQVYENAGLTQEQVRQIVKENPELADLPAEKVASFAGRLLARGSQGAPRARSGGAPPVPDYGDPALAVDGGPSVFGNPAEDPTDADGMGNITQYRKIGYGVGRPSVAEAQKQALLKRLAGSSVFR